MDEKYDAVVLGTGLKECIISGLLSSVAKLKVSHLKKSRVQNGVFRIPLSAQTADKQRAR